MAQLGILLQIDVPVYHLAGPVREDQRVQPVVPGHEARADAGEIGVVAHVQMGQAVVIQMDKLQIGQHGKIHFRQLVIKGFDELQAGVGGKVHRLQIVAAAIDDLQRCAAGQVEGGHVVVFTVEGQQLVQAGHVQAVDAVIVALQIAQGAVLLHVQRFQGIVLAVEGLQRGEYLNALQRGDAHGGDVDLPNVLQLLLGEHAVGAGAVQVGRIRQPLAEYGVGEHVLRDGDVGRTGQRCGEELAGQQQRKQGREALPGESFHNTLHFYS